MGIGSAAQAIVSFEYWPEIGEGTLDTLIMTDLMPNLVAIAVMITIVVSISATAVIAPVFVVVLPPVMVIMLGKNRSGRHQSECHGKCRQKLKIPHQCSPQIQRTTGAEIMTRLGRRRLGTFVHVREVYEIDRHCPIPDR